MTRNYGQRVCMSCGKVFEATKITDITCSPECKAKRAKDLRIEAGKRHRMQMQESKIICDDLQEDMKVLIDVFIGFIKEDKIILTNDWKTKFSRELFEKVQNCFDERVVQKNNTEIIKEKNEEVVLKECKRMNARMLHLPCGQREECFMNQPCEKIPDDVIKDTQFCKFCKKPIFPDKNGKKKSLYCSKKCEMADIASGEEE